MNILIVKSAALGDVLRTTSLLRPLRERYPDGKISWITAAAARPLLRGNPLIRKIATIDEASGLSEGTFDLVLSMEEDLETARLARRFCGGELIGIRAEADRLTYTPSSAPYYDMSLLNRAPDGSLEIADGLKAENRLTYAELWLKILGIRAPKDRSLLRPSIVLDAEDRAAAAALSRKLSKFSNSRPIGINPGAGRRWPSKQLSEDKAVEIVLALHERFSRPILLLGGSDEAERNRRIAGRCGRAAVDAGTGHSLRAFAGLVELCGALVTTDSLAFHMATALDRPAAVLIGPTSACELDVFGRGAKLLPATPCACFYKPSCTRQSHCLDEIAARDIVRAVEGFGL